MVLPVVVCVCVIVLGEAGGGNLNVNNFQKFISLLPYQRRGQWLSPGKLPIVTHMLYSFLANKMMT